MDSDAAWENWRGTTTMGWEVGRVPEHQGVRLQDPLHNKQERCIGLSGTNEMKKGEPGVGVAREERDA